MSLTDPLMQVLSEIPGGRVLDVATNAGGFVGVLAQYLKSYTSIAGIDTSALALGEARGWYGDRGCEFAQMDAGHAGLASESMDTVAFSAALHHLPAPGRALAEAVRILRPRGHLVLAEMHCDADTQAQQTMVRAHHWVADVDTALGGLHHHTLTRKEIVDLVEALRLDGIRLIDQAGIDADPLDVRRIEALERTLEGCLKRIRLAGDHDKLARRGEALRQRLCAIGAQPEPVLILVGRKA